MLTGSIRPLFEDSFATVRFENIHVKMLNLLDSSFGTVLKFLAKFMFVIVKMFEVVEAYL